MQIVIDIPKEIYETLRKADAIISSQRSNKSLTSIIFDAVAKGTPLNKIRAEIDGAKVPKNQMSFFRDGINYALHIIDKYRNEVRE